MVLNKTYTDKAVQSLHAHKLYHNNYYLSEDDVVHAIAKPILEALEGSLRTCLNFDGSKCDLWYLDSHIGCLQVMKILYLLTSDDQYNPSRLEYTQDEIW
jgi:hypothetical protein